MLVVVRSTPSCSQVCWIEGVERLENTIMIHLVDGIPRAGDDGFGTAILGIEVSKEDMAAISDYEVLVQKQLICPT